MFVSFEHKDFVDTADIVDAQSFTEIQRVSTSKDPVFGVPTRKIMIH